MRKSNHSTGGKGRRIRRTCAAYLLAASAAALGWLYSSLPDHILLEPGQALLLPRFAYIEPLGSGNTQNVVSTRTVGSYQTTLSIGGVFPVKTVRLSSRRGELSPSAVPLLASKCFQKGHSLLVLPTSTARMVSP